MPVYTFDVSDEQKVLKKMNEIRFDQRAKKAGDLFFPGDRPSPSSLLRASFIITSHSHVEQRLPVQIIDIEEEEP